MRRIAAVGVLFGMLAVALALPGHAAAAGGSPAGVNFGGVPINTTASRDVTITVDAGYRTEVASGSGLNAPFALRLQHLRHRRRLQPAPASCTVTERFTPTTTSASSGTTNVFECPIVGGSCIAIPFSVQGTGSASPPPTPPASTSVACPSTPPPPAPSRSPSTLATSSLSSPAAGSTPRSASPSGTCAGNFPRPRHLQRDRVVHAPGDLELEQRLHRLRVPRAGGSCLPINVPVQGAGISVFAANPASVDFGNVPINTTASRGIT